MRRFLKYTFQGLVIVGAGLFTACSLLYDLSADQCEIDADCAAIGLTGRRCVAGVCTATNAPTGGSGGGGGSSGSGGCTSNKDCLGEETIIDPSVCIEGACVDLTTDECPVVVPLDPKALRENLITGSPIVFGAFAPLGSDQTGVELLNYDLAFTEFKSTVNGLPAVGAGGRRPLVGVVCEAMTEGDIGVIDRGMEHLVDALRVPGIIGGLYPEELQHAFDTKGLEAGVFIVSPGESERQLVATDDDGLMWHLLPGGGEIAASYPAVLDRVIEHLETTSAIDSSEPVRVALVTADIRFLNQVREVIQDSLRFNGDKSPSENEDDGNWLSMIIPPGASDLGDETQELVDFRPHVIIGNAFVEFLAEMMPGIEALWPDEEGEQARPFYVLSPFQYNQPGLSYVLGLEPTIRRRMIGMNAPAAEDSTLYDEYLTEFKVKYRDVMNPEGFENYYDAAYFLIYAAAAADRVPGPLTGAHLAQGMLRLLDGPTDVGVGAKRISGTLIAISRSDPPDVRLHGTLGPPDFTPSGARKSAGSVWCIDSTGQIRSDVLRYDAESDELYGDFPCFSDF